MASELDPKYFQHLLDSFLDIIMAVDNQGIVIYYNDGARQNLKYAPDEIMGQGVAKIYASLDEAKRVMRAMREAADHRIANFETVLRDKAGAEIPAALSGAIIYDDAGNELSSVGFVRDIRGLRQRQALETTLENAIAIAHEINNPLQAIVNNLELVRRALDDPDPSKLAEAREPLAMIRDQVDVVHRIVELFVTKAGKGELGTAKYVRGEVMTNLEPPDASSIEKSQPSAPTPEFPLAGMSLIVLDDKPEIVESLADLLRGERCIVYAATRPLDALGIAREVKVDAVISDVVMPEMDGYEFYMAVKKDLPHLPVILMTAYYYDQDHIIKRSRVEGLAGAIFNKPVNPDKLREILGALRK